MTCWKTQSWAVSELGQESSPPNRQSILFPWRCFRSDGGVSCSYQASLTTHNFDGKKRRGSERRDMRPGQNQAQHLFHFSFWKASNTHEENSTINPQVPFAQLQLSTHGHSCETSSDSHQGPACYAASHVRGNDCPGSAPARGSPSPPAPGPARPQGGRERPRRKGLWAD